MGSSNAAPAVPPQNVLRHDVAEAFASELLSACGAPEDHARIVAAHLTTNSRMGFHSHGLARLTQYVRRIQAGSVDPAATPVIESQDGARTIVDGRRGFGQVAAERAVQETVAAASSGGVACTLLYNTGHVGRLGAYTERAASQGFVALGFLSGTRDVHRVAPFGAREARLATNPISFAFPTQDAPVVSDFATSVRAEGFVRNLFHSGQPVPDGVLRDAAGVPTSDPAALYSEPPGTLQPLGGDQGYKGFALAILAEVMATLLVGGDTADPNRYGNNLALVAIRVDDRFPGRAAALCDYVRSAAPLADGVQVQLPGDVERRRLESSDLVQIDEATWSDMRAVASELGVAGPHDGADAPGPVS